MSVACWYVPVQVCPGVSVNPVLHLQSVRELASPDVSLLIKQLDECNVLVPTCTGLPGGASEPSFTPTVSLGARLARRLAVDWTVGSV